jgi:hypothetical protein
MADELSTDHEAAIDHADVAAEQLVQIWREEATRGGPKAIERQHEQISRSLHVDIGTPRPKGRLRFVDAGLEFVVRYPVELRQSAEIDDRITRELMHAINEEPKLKLVSSGVPKIQTT